MRRALALAALVLAAGCLEQGAPPPESTTSDPARSPLVFHRWSDSLFVVFDDASAHLVDLGGLNATTLDPDLARVVAASGATVAYGVADATIPPATFARLTTALAIHWPDDVPESDSCMDRLCDAILARAGNGTWETRTLAYADPRGDASLMELVAALFEAETVFGFPPLLEERPKALPNDDVHWQGMDSEFGAIRAPYRVALANASRAAVQAEVLLREHYVDEDARFFMFAWIVEDTPLDVMFDSLARTDTGEELPCYQREENASVAVRCFVAIDDMPAPGTGIRMTGTVGSSEPGAYALGALVVPYSGVWSRIAMQNGLNAELYAATQVDAAPPQASSG